MSDKPKKLKPSNKPQTVSEKAWFYESKRGIELVTQIRDKENFPRRTNG